MEAKVLNDPIHGQVKMHPLCITIIDTPQFQRLRRIKQLGGVYHVYYGASHNRFEHSIGVCHLAGKLMTHLESQQPELGIDNRDILCVEIAGLCHDLGHGPFSHLWDRSILGCLNKPEWKHEHGSVTMFDHLVEENKLRPEFKEHLNLKNDEDLTNELTFIKELISGRKTGKSGTWEMKGRPESKAFLYEMIANNENGIDVDKWDYFARDCHYLGLPKSFDHQRLMSFARVLDITKGTRTYKQICYRDKEASNVYGMFYTRSLLHQKAYKHKTVKAIECMLSDAIVCSNTLLKFHGKNGDMKPLVETINDMVAYVQVDDEVIGQIMKMRHEVLENDADKEALIKAQRILERIEKRQIYRCLSSDPLDSKELKGFDIEEETKKLLYFFTKSKLSQEVTTEDFSLELVSYDYGMKDENPVDKVFFYRKSNPNTSKKISKHEVSMMLPKTFSETRILLLFKKSTPEEGPYQNRKLFEDVTDCFKEYCKHPTIPENSDGKILYRRESDVK